MNHREFLKLAVEAAMIGGRVIRDGFHKPKEITLKGFADPVTQFDKESERRIVERILKTYPGHSILTEEALSRTEDSDVRWVIDPLDGTVNFTHRMPYVCVSIGVEAGGELVAGVIYNPILEELYTASKSEGAFLNRQRIAVSKVSEAGRSMVVTGFPYRREGRVGEILKPLRTVVKDYEGFRRLGSAAMDLAYVAAGICEIFYEENLNAWDTAAGAILVNEAGGRVTDYAGKPFALNSKTILATNGILHDEFVGILSDVVPPE